MRRTPSLDRSAAVAADPPRLSREIELLPPMEGSADWFIRRGTQQYFKIKPDLAHLVTTIDGTTTKKQIVDELGDPWDLAQVDLGLQLLAKADVLEGQRPPRQRGPLRFVPPLTIQLTLCNPSRMLTWLARLMPWVKSPVLLSVSVGVAVAGLVVLLLRGDALVAALSQPVSYATLFALFLGILVSTALHEVGHGLVLAAYGAAPNRLGVMLFYLLPAFFCDVSDGWRLPKPSQRVHVAMAGIAVQWMIAGTSALLTLVPVLDGWSQGLMIFTVITFTASLMNLIPFVKLDGYIALMNHVDVSHLRDKAIADARGWTLRLLLGVTPPPRQLPQFRWAILFGIGCMIFPLVIVANALLIWSTTLQRLGPAGSGILLFALVAALFGLGKELFSGFSWKTLSTAVRVRAVGVAAVVAAGAAVALAVIPVPQTLSGGYIVEESDSELLLPASASLSLLEAGDRVSLREAGIVLQGEIGVATVAASADAAEASTRPFYSLFAVTDVEPRIPVTILPITLVEEPAVSHGVAVVELGDVPLGVWLLQRIGLSG
ncbi:putative peptide zinc metalloprotease protein [Microbacterium laevaniformans]|uniref:daptide biosynthesis intramembrane metalloprotease n=2 Tax=Bacillati TaxID=1783272 RepID=UPI00195AF7C3|nr:daptide biosynthesis intramembrane metalloprotease [Microbacterium laevaniformans]MBM7752360.1 putative peptide zinc metalloprotease protein [Microbacterium laevaniformans]